MASKFWKKTMAIIGLEPAEASDEYGYEEEQQYEPVNKRERITYEEPQKNYTQPQRSYTGQRRETMSRDYSAINATQRSNVVDFRKYNSQATPDLKMKIFRPSTIEESRLILDNIQMRNAVIVNLDGVEVKLAQRILDFLSGGIYSLDGGVTKVARNIFVLAPSSVDVTMQDDNSVSSESFDAMPAEEEDYYEETPQYAYN